MPIPKPRKGEDKNDFVGRCISQLSTKNEFKDRVQRGAVCLTSWRDDKRKIIK